MVVVALSGCTQLLGIPDPERAPPAPPPHCASTTSFSRFAPAAGLNTPDRDEHHVWLSRDERTAVVTRDVRGRASDLFVADRADRDAAFGDAVLLDELSTTADEYRASMADDGLTIYFDRKREEVVGFQIFAASRAASDQRFGPPTAMPVIDETGQNLEPFVTPDGLYFASSRDVTGILTLHFAARDGDRFGPPYPVIGHPAGVSNESPVVSFDGLEIYFSAARSPTEPDSDIWTASRASPQSPFGVAHRVDEVNGPGLESPSWISEDNCRLYVSTDRGGTRDLWIAERDPDPPLD